MRQCQNMRQRFKFPTFKPINHSHLPHITSLTSINRQMDIMISSDPWDGLEVNLSTVTLTEREKIWIGQEIASGRKTPKSLAKRFNLNRKKIQWYGKMAKKGKVPRSQVGRPPRIDQIGVVKLLSISTNASDDEKRH